MRRAVAILAAALVVAAAAPHGIARPRAAAFDVEVNCSATPPAAHSSTVVDGGQDVSVEVGVFLDGIPKARARDLMGKAAGPYAELNVTLVPAFYRRVRIVPDTPASGETRATVDAGEAIGQVKAVLGGKRPAAVDVVHVLTAKDLTLPAYGSTPVGVAECAGGVQWDDKAFSVSEDGGVDAYSLDAPGLMSITDSPAEAIAHEIGHLLGGLHEYKSCVEGASADDAANRDPSPCTIMSDVVDLASLRFGVLEGAVVRGYALEFGG